MSHRAQTEAFLQIRPPYSTMKLSKLVPVNTVAAQE